MATAITPLANITLSSSASTVTFSSISGSYRDLYLVMNITATGSMGETFIQLNTDTGSNYSNVYMQGTGSAANSGTTWATGLFLSYTLGTNPMVNLFTLFDYSATDKHKTSLNRHNKADSTVEAMAGRWANTSAVTSLKILSSSASFAAGSTFSLFGVSA